MTRKFKSLRVFPRRGRFMELPARFGDISGPGPLDAIPGTEALRTGHAGSEGPVTGWLQSHTLQNPLLGVAVRAPIGSATKVSYGFRQGPTGSTVQEIETSGLYQPAANQVGIAIAGAEQLNTSATGILVTNDIQFKSGTAFTGSFKHSNTGNRTYALQNSDGTLAFLSDIAAGYTDEQAQDAAGGILVDTATCDLTYNDATPSITVDVKDNAITNGKLADAAAWTIKIRNASSSGDPSDAALADWTIGAPLSGDYLVGYKSTGELRRFDAAKFLSGGSSHDLLSATHTDTAAQTVSRGSLIYGNATPAWDELVIDKTSGKVLTSDSTDVSWKNTSGALAIKYYESLAKSNIGTSYVDIYTTGTAFHETRLDKCDWANVNELRIIWIWDYVGAGTQQVRWVDVADNTKVLYESPTFTSDQDPADSGWVTRPAAFTTLQAVEWQGKSTTAGDDPIAKGYSIYVR